MFQVLPSLYGERHRCLHAGCTCTCRDRGGAVSLGSGPMEILLDEMRLSENPCQHNHDLSYYFDHTESDLVSINPIGEIKFSIGDGDEVRHNKISIDSLYSCTDEQRKRPLTWGGWSWVCGVLWFRCSHRGRGTSQGCS